MAYNVTRMGPNLQAQYKQDPRLAMALRARQQGTSMEPARTPAAAIARALQGSLGGYLSGQVREDYMNRAQQEERERQEQARSIAAQLTGFDPTASTQAALEAGGGPTQEAAAIREQTPGQQRYEQIAQMLASSPEALQAGQASVLEAMTRQPDRMTGSDLVEVRGPDGQPVFVPADQAVGQTAFTEADKPSARQERLDMLVSTGVPENIARGIVAGRYTTSRDPINQTVQVVDLASGQTVGQTPQGTERAQATESAAQEVQRARNVPEGTDMAQGTGASGFAANIANTVSDAFGQGTMYPQAEEASQALKNLQIRTQTAMQSSVPGRPSNYLMEQLRELSVTPNSLLQGDARAKTRLRQTRDMLKNEVARMKRDILGNRQDFTPKQIAETRANVSQLDSILQNYDQVLDQFGTEGGERGGGPPPQEIRTMNRQQLDSLNANEMTQQQLEAASERYDQLQGGQ